MKSQVTVAPVEDATFDETSAARRRQRVMKHIRRWSRHACVYDPSTTEARAGLETTGGTSMAHLWIYDAPGEWRPVELDATTFVLDASRPMRTADLSAARVTDSLIALRRVDGDPGSLWVLLAGASATVLINGYTLPTGIAVLSDRDEIRIPSSLPTYFSSEELAVVAPFQGHRGVCPRCKQGLTSGEPAVRCPGCGLWHHESPEIPCWTYAEHCAACPQPTALDAGFRWSPAEL